MHQNTMIDEPIFQPSTWPDIRLVVFDVDGTLYRQQCMRLRIARDMLVYTVSQRSLTVFYVIRAFRKIRERIGDQQVLDFERVLIEKTASKTNFSLEEVQEIVSEWMEHRPLDYIFKCRYAGLVELFAGIRRSGKVIGIFSDYPASIKLSALGLQADHIICASDKRVGLLKPHPRGLQALIEMANVEPHQTVLIGDRAERDGLAARSIGAWSLIKSPRKISGWKTFSSFDDKIFDVFTK